MKKNDIHFVTDLLIDTTVISGMRINAEVIIYINLKLAITEGLQFYKSLNNVVLSPGDKDGFIRPKYFLRVCDGKGHILH